MIIIIIIIWEIWKIWKNSFDNGKPENYRQF